MTLTTDEILKQQAADHAPKPVSPPEAPPSNNNAPAVRPQGTLPAIPPDEDAIGAGVNEFLSSIGVRPGTAMRFDGKDGKFVLAQTKETVEAGRELVAHVSKATGGFVKFNKDGGPPDRIAGFLFEGYKPPKREDLGDLDESEWPIGLSGRAEDVWKPELCVPMADPATAELFVFQALNATSRNAVGALIDYYTRLRKTKPGLLPVIKLTISGYADRRRGGAWVPTPRFVIVGRVEEGSVTPPDTSPAADLEDEIPF